MKRNTLRVLTVLAATLACLMASWYASRHYLAGELGQRVVSGGGASRAFASELASLDTAALGPLANASAVADTVVAGAARREIDLLVLRWSRREEQEPRFDASSRRLSLARNLQRHGSQYTPSGRLWLAKITEALLKSQSAQEPSSTELISLCDSLFAISRERSEKSDLSPRPVVVARQQRLPEETTVPMPASPRLSPAEDPRPVVRGPAPQATPEARGPRSLPPPRQLTELPVGSLPIKPQEPAPITPPLVSRRLQSEDRRGVSTDLPWQKATRPRPRAAGPSGLPRPRMVKDVIGGSLVPMLALVHLPDRELLQVGLTNDNRMVHAVLLDRGFGEATPQQLRAAISGDESERLALIDQLLVTAGGASARLLLMLGQDESPRVRAAALGALGASRDPRLVNAAWRMAVQDPDPRVARLANSLRR